MLNMLVSSTMMTEVNAVEAPTDASSETITKIAQDAISGSTPTKQSNSIIQKKDGSSATMQTTSSAEAVKQVTQSQSAVQTVDSDNNQTREAGLGTVKAKIDSTTKTLYLSGGVLPDKVADDYGNSPWVFPNSPYVDLIEHISIDGEISAKDIFNLFHGLKKLKTVQGLGNIKGATNFESLFNGDSLLESVDATNLDFSNVTSVANMFSGCWALTTVGDSSAWQLGHVTNMRSFFSSDRKLTNLNTANWDTSQVTNMDSMFLNAETLTTLEVANWDVSKVTDLSYAFSGCKSLKTLDVANWQTGQVKTLANTFGNYKGKILDVAHWDTAKVVSMNSTFSGVESAPLDVSHWQTGNVKTMYQMFYNYHGGNLDVSHWDTHQVTNMSGMFWGTRIEQLASDNWDTSQVTNMEAMFRDANQLTTVGTANWDTSQVKTLRTFLYQATALTDLDLSNWNTGQVADISLMLTRDSKLNHLKLGPNVRMYDTKGVFAALPEPSTETPYFGKWQRHDANDNQVGNTYTSAELMAQYDGTTVPTGDYYWAVATPPTITKLVRNVTADGNNAPFKTATTAQKGDIVEYQVNITQPSGQKLDRGAIFEDVLDSHLKLDSSKGLMIAYATAGSDFDMFQLINFNDQWQFATGQTMEIGQKAQVKIKATVADDGVPEIDNLFKLVSGSYGAGTTSNTAVIHVKKPLKLTKAVKNETTDTNWGTKQDVSPGDRVGFTLDYQNTTGATSKQVTFNDPLITNELTYQTGSLKVTYQDGTTETVSDAAQTQFATTGKLTLTKSLANYEAVKLSFSATVNPLVTSGTTLHNKATVTADNVSQPVTSNTVDMNVIQSEHQLTIRYVDLDEDLSQPASAGTQIAAPITVTGKTGTALSALLPGQQVAPKVIDGYTIYSVSEDPDLKPENWQKAYRDDPQIGDQDRIITYGYKKAMLSIDAPSSWEFGDYNNKPMNRTYYLNDNHGTPQAVTVTDNYGVQNWQLQVSQAKPFVDDDQHELTGAKWVFSNGNVKTLSNTDAGTVTNNSDHFTLVPGQTATLMTMTKSGHFQSDSPDTSDRDNPYTQVGQGQWAYRFGDEQSADYSIGLNVPATTKRYTGHYRTKLTWSLSVGP
ncbi:BspA family leucine-rich repeat surface protein [Latilactobacillus curvatus]|nr:BspA family leucine-rich repeat surface protein [Latilactobacillus curvatus]